MWSIYLRANSRVQYLFEKTLSFLLYQTTYSQSQHTKVQLAKNQKPVYSINF
jgi:hypothetical protein